MHGTAGQDLVQTHAFVPAQKLGAQPVGGAGAVIGVELGLLGPDVVRVEVTQFSLT